MLQVPVTFLFDFDQVSEKMRPYIMHEFAANGAKHLVLSGPLISQIMHKCRLQDVLLKEMAAEGLSFLDSHAPSDPFFDINSPDEKQRPQILLRQKLALQIAADMGIKTMTLHIGNEPFQPAYPLELQYDCVKRALDELLPAAEALDVIICIENIYYQLNTPERLLGIKKEFPSEHLAFCYDSGHANLMDNGRYHAESETYKMWGETPPQFDDKILEKMLPHVVNCHLHDNDGITDQHTIPGGGSADWKRIIPLLEKAPLLQVVQSEVSLVRNHISIAELCAQFREFCA